MNHTKTMNIPIHLFHSLKHSLRGLQAAFKYEVAFRLEVLLCIIFIPLAFLVGHTTIERILLIASLLLIAIVELINSAIEAIVDRIGPERNELSGRAKDISSAAVLIALLNAIVVWGLIILL